MARVLFSKDFGWILDPDLSSRSVESNMLHSFGYLVQQYATSSNNVGFNSVDDPFGRAFNVADDVKYFN